MMRKLHIKNFSSNQKFKNKKLKIEIAITITFLHNIEFVLYKQKTIN